MMGDPPTIVTLDLVADHTDCIKLVLWEEKKMMKCNPESHTILVMSHCEGLVMTNMLTLISQPS